MRDPLLSITDFRYSQLQELVYWCKELSYLYERRDSSVYFVWADGQQTVRGICEIQTRCSKQGDAYQLLTQAIEALPPEKLFPLYKFPTSGDSGFELRAKWLMEFVDSIEREMQNTVWPVKELDNA